VYEIVWEFQAAPHREDEFEIAYGSTGPWVSLFRRDPGFLGTELVKPRERGGWYRTIDRWESAQAYARFMQTWHAEYSALDEACERLTLQERRLGHEAAEP
jgi:heme-degrading monooxygenase HmoA